MNTRLILTGLVLSTVFLTGRAPAAETIKGQVLGGGAPIAQSTVTLWAASADAPKQIAQTKTGDDGWFVVRSLETGGATVKGKRSGAVSSTSTAADPILYLVAAGGESKASKTGGDNPAIVLIAVVGSNPPESVVVNEFTTVASVWTHAQFLNGSAIQGPPLGLRI